MCCARVATRTFDPSAFSSKSQGPGRSDSKGSHRSLELHSQLTHIHIPSLSFSFILFDKRKSTRFDRSFPRFPSRTRNRVAISKSHVPRERERGKRIGLLKGTREPPLLLRYVELCTPHDRICAVLLQNLQGLNQSNNRVRRLN